jgi:hypothetical protein
MEKTTKRRAGRMVVRFACVIAALCIVLGATASSPASADTVPTPSMDAYCGYGNIAVDGPDIRMWAPYNWSVYYRVVLFKWTSYGWVKIGTAPSTSTYYVSRTQDWVAPTTRTFSVPHNTFISASVQEWWYLNGTYMGYRYVAPIHQDHNYIYSSTNWCVTS